jgi:hypothetical protein
MSKETLAIMLALAVPLTAGDRRCVDCHPKEVTGYRQSAMSHSLNEAPTQPDGAFEHALSKTRFSIRSSAAGMWQRFDRTGERGEQRVAYVIGSGAHAFGYLVQIGDYLFQSPLSYYTNRHQWDVAPGYEDDLHPDFSRPVTLECVLCHSGQPQPLPDTLNGYRTPAFLAQGISCERCHGPGEKHAENPTPGSIVNPAKLSGPARDSICEQCHLTGEVRIPNPGKSISDFQPGESLENTYTVYVASQGIANTLKVVGHAEQLARSVCARNSGGKLWCGSCHNPHETAANPVVYYRERCLRCHGPTLDKSHAAPGRDCVACHMPRLAARDGGHTVFTDHRIARRPEHRDASDQPEGLSAWREPEPPLRSRNLALALVTAGFENSSSQQVIRGYRLLNQVVKEYPDDPDVLTTLGTVLLRGKQPVEALRRFEKALLLRPAYAPFEVNVATALLAANNKTEAQRHLEKALQLDPLLQPAVELLRALYRDQGEGSKADSLGTQYRRKMDGTPPQ